MKRDNDNNNGINIPDGLEARLSDAIDGWAADEARRRRSRVMCVAYACVIALVGVFAGMAIFNSIDMMPANSATIADTYTNPEDAAKAVNYAIQMLHQSFDQSFAELEQVNEDIGSIKNAVIIL